MSLPDAFHPGNIRIKGHGELGIRIIRILSRTRLMVEKPLERASTG